MLTEEILKVRERALTAARDAISDLDEGVATLAPLDFSDRLDELIKSLAATALRMAPDRTVGGARRLSDFMDRSLAEMHRRALGESKPVPVPWPDLADLLGGGYWTGAHILVGGTGLGKTQLELQLALHAARAGVPVLYVALELGEADIATRLMALLEEARPSPFGPGIHASDLMHGKVPDARLSALEVAARKHLYDLPINVVTGDSYGWSYDRLVPQVQALRAQYEIEPHQPVLVVLDYLQLVASPKDAREDVRERIGRAAYQARHAARTLNAAVICISSTARTNDKILRAWGREWPSETVKVSGETYGLWDLVGLGKEAGEVEYCADTVMVMASVAPVEGEKVTRVRTAIAKNRYGRPGETTLLFTGSRWDEDRKRQVAVDSATKALAAKKAEAEAKRTKSKQDRQDKPQGQGAGVSRPNWGD